MESERQGTKNENQFHVYMKKYLLILIAALTAATVSLNARTIVINEGFENGIQDSLWTQEFVSGSTAWAVESISDSLSYPSTVRQGTHRAYLRNTTGETIGYKTRLVSKVMDLRPTKVYMPELTFWYANPKWGGDRDTLRVLYRTGQRAQWKQIAEYSTASADWQRVKIDLPEVGATYQIAFEGSDNLGRGIVLDSVKLQSAPECTVPYSLIATSKGASKVNIAWMASYDAEYYELIISTDTIDPNLIETVDESKIAFHGNVYGQTNYDLKLTPGQSYLAYVRSVCEDENSAWSSEAAKEGPYGFLVRETKQVPYSNLFNHLSGTADPAHDPDWTWGSNTGNPNPYVNTRTTSKATRGNYSPDSTAAVIFSGGTTTSPSTFIPADRYVYLATPALSDSTNEDFSLSQCQVHFWSTVYTYTGRQYGRSLMVGVMTDPEDITTFVPVDTVSVWGNKTFHENIVDLASYRGNGAYVAFVSDFDRQNLFYIDDITVEYKRAHNKVTSVSVNPRDTFATITWEGNASSYNVLVTNQEVNPSSPAAEAVVAQATVNTTSYVCDALEANHGWNRPYYVYVQAAGTEWSYRYPFVTIAPRREIPYTFDMEAGTPTYKIPSDPNTYVTELGVFGNGGTYPSMVTNSNNSYAGSGYLYMNKRGGTDAWVTLPMVESLSDVQVKFFLSGNTTFAQSHATIGVMSNPMDVNTFVPVSHFMLNASGYTRCYANFESYHGPDGVIAILWDDVMRMSQNTINYIDEIIVEELSDCVPPTNIELEIMPDSVVASWEIGLADEWEFFLSRTALTESQRVHKSLQEIRALPGVVLASTLSWNNPSSTARFGFGNLAPNTKYYLYVRATCDLEWWTEMAFSTPCQEEEFPYKETFESYNTGSTSIGCWQLADYLGVDYPRIYQAGSTSASNKTLELYSSGTIHRSVAVLPPVEGNISDMLLSFDVRNLETSSSTTGLVIVGTMDDIADQSSFVVLDSFVVAGGSAFKKIRLDLSQYQITGEFIAITSGLGSLKMNSDILIDNVELKDPSCVEAYDYATTNVGPNDFDLSWSGTSPTNTWEIKVLNTNVSISAVNSGNYNSAYVVVDTLVTGNSLHVSDLLSQKSYYIYIHTLCGDSLWSSTSVRTTCDMLDATKPNKETFENYSNGTLPDCWTIGKALSSDGYPYIYQEDGNSMLRIHQSNATGSVVWAASPLIKCDSLTSVLVTFSISTYSGDNAVFGVMTDPNDISTFVPIDSMAGTGESNFQVYTYDLSGYASIIPPSAKYCAWRGRFGRFDYLNIDDVSFVSQACPMPKPGVSELTTENARVNSGLRTSDPWILLLTDHPVSADDLANDDYVVPSDWVILRDTISARSIVVSELKGRTKYYIAASTLCEDSVNSLWSTTSFMTPCTSVTPEELGVVTFSEYQGFDVGTDGEKPCWTVGSKSLNATAGYIPYVGDEANYKHDGNNYLKLQDYVSGTDASATHYVGAYAVMPQLAVDSISKYQVNFWSRGASTGANRLIVGVVTDASDLNTFVAIDTVNLDPSAWNPYSVGFETYESDYMGEIGTNIMFLSDFGASNTAYLSEVSVELIPRCRPISSFSVDSIGESSVIISWKGYQDSYRVLLANKSLTEAEKATYHYLLDTMVNRSDNVLIGNLEAAANYYVYAQGICEDGDSTAISLTYASFVTACPTVGGAALPFYDDFERYDEGELFPGCWQMKWAGSSRPSYFYVRTVEDLGGSKAINVWNSAYMVLPRVNGNLENLRLSFDARSYSGSSASKMYVGVMADPNDVTTFVLLRSFDLKGSMSLTHCAMNLGDYELPYDNLVITSGISGVTPSTEDNYLDNVGLELLATCNSPKLSVAAIATNSIELNLAPSSRDDSKWEIAVLDETQYGSISNVEQYLATATTIVSESTHIIVNNLEPATSYYIYARTLCSDTDISTWTRNPLKVTTQFYFADSYFFGFEKEDELWERSPYSASDNYYLHPALESGRDDIGRETETYKYYPHSLANTSTELYSQSGVGALLLYSQSNLYGGYVVFPAIEEAEARSFEFKTRQGSVDATSKLPKNSFDCVLEIGSVEKGKSFDTYQPMALLHLPQLAPNVTAKAKNYQLYSTYTLDLDSATMATRQLVLHLPKQPKDTAFILVDNVTLGASKGFNLVSLSKITVDGESALIEWANIGGPWNLTVKNEAGTTVATYPNLTATSQRVEGLNPQTNYTATLEAAVIPAEATGYTLSDKMSFRTLCRALESDAEGNYSWDFDDAASWEANDVLSGDGTDSLYLKPECFTTGITYSPAVNGYQWLVQRKGYNPGGALGNYSSSRQYEVGRGDSHSLRVHTTNDEPLSYLVLPELSSDLDTMMIEWYSRCFVTYDRQYSTASYRNKIVDLTYLGAGYSHSLVVGTLTDPNDFSTLQVLDTLTYSHVNLTINDNVEDDPDGLRYWEKMIMPLTGAQGKYIVLFQPAPGLMYIDNLAVKPIGNTLFAPANTRTTSITTTSAMLNWTERQTQLRTVVVLLDAIGETELLRDTITGTSYPLTGLEPGMRYQWYAYQIGDSGNSPASKPVVFLTECAENSKYSTSFEPAQGWVLIGGNAAYRQTPCWTYSDAQHGEWVSATYDPYNQPNTTSILYSHTGENAVVMRASYSSRGTSYQPYVAMPAMDVNAYDTLQVSFWIRPANVSATTGNVMTTYTGSSYSKSLIVGTMADPTLPATFVPIDTVTFDGTLSTNDAATPANNFLYQQMKVELVGATGPYVAFMTSFHEKGGTTQKTGDYIWLDDVAFERIQECKEPKELENVIVGSTHAVLHWNGVDSAGSYHVQVSTDPYFADEKSIVFSEDVTSNTCTVKGLEPLTTYVWRVKSLCGGRWGESSYSQKATFTTGRSPYFLEEFTTAVSANDWIFSKAHADQVVDSTGVLTRGVDNWSFIRTTTNYGLAGPHYVAAGYSGDYHWMVTPNFYLPEQDSVHLSIDIALTACNTAHGATGNAVTDNDMKDDFYFMIIVSDDGGASWKSRNILAKWQNTNPSGKQLRDIPSTGMKVRYSLAQFAGKNIRVGLYREAKSTSNTGIAIHVDNLRLGYFDKTVDYTSACQYEDIQIGDIILPGDETQPGIHSYPTCFYVDDAAAKAGQRDSVFALEVEVFPAKGLVLNDTICEGETYSDENFTAKDETGTYRRKLVSSLGCDSIITLNLSVTPRLYGQETEVAICPAEPYIWHDREYNRAGVYRDTLLSSLGCDSVETLVVTYIDSKEDTIFVSDTISLDELPYEYQNAEHPYFIGQTPIAYPEGTPAGEYRAVVLVQGTVCSTVLVHNLLIYDPYEAIDAVTAEDDKARKVIYRDQLYIILHGEWYNSAGQKVPNPMGE